MTLSITTICNECHHAECLGTEYHVFLIICCVFMLIVIMPVAIMLSGAFVMFLDVALNVYYCLINTLTFTLNWNPYLRSLL